MEIRGTSLEKDLGETGFGDDAFETFGIVLIERLRAEVRAATAEPV